MKNNHFLLIGAVLAVLLIAGVALVTRSNPAVPPPLPTPTASGAEGLLSTTEVPGPGVTATPEADGVVRFAWFYKPPDSTQTELVLKRSSFYILTHKDEGERDQFKQRGVTGPFSMYLLFLVINDPGDCAENPNGNQVAYKPGDFCQISREHPDWFLLDGNGNRIQSRKDSYYMDPGNQGYRAFWLERARELQETYGWDNIFLDNVEGSRVKMIGENGTLAQYPDDTSYQQAVEGFLSYIRSSYFQPAGKPMYANIVSVGDDKVWEGYMKYLDGAMIESFATDWSNGYRSQDEWTQQMQLVEKALAAGKTMILVAQGRQQDTKLQTFAFASYLLVANGNAYFRYTHSEAYRELWLYENYDYDLGAPLGARYKYKSGWRRDFAHGYVVVNPKNHKAEIVFNP